MGSEALTHGAEQFAGERARRAGVGTAGRKRAVVAFRWRSVSQAPRRHAAFVAAAPGGSRSGERGSVECAVLAETAECRQRPGARMLT
jgi:hypothetical protein